MIDPLTTAMLVGAALLAALAGFFAARNRSVDNIMLGAAAVVELLLLAQLIVGIVQLASTHRDLNAAVFVAYLVGLVLVLPVAAVWAIAERSRWGMGVMVVAGLALLVMVARVRQLWTGTGV